MTTPSYQPQESRERRLTRLQQQLAHLDNRTPYNEREKELLTREIRLVKLESQRPQRNRSQNTAGANRQKTTVIPGSGKTRKSGIKKKASLEKKGIATEALGGLGKVLTPKNFEESLGSIVTLRDFCKQCMKYVQQADTLLDTLFVTGNSLKESGVLTKIAESKGKNLNTTDFTNILMALMNSPLGANIFKKIGGGESETAQTTNELAGPTTTAAIQNGQRARPLPPA